MEEYNIVTKTINIPKSLNNTFKKRAKQIGGGQSRLVCIAIDYFLTLPERNKKKY